MPLHFFQLAGDREELVDEIGHDLPDLEAARRLALRAVREIIAEEMALGRERVRIAILVDGDEGRRLLSMPVTVSAGEQDLAAAPFTPPGAGPGDGDSAG